jgi:hypothetical protein
MLHPYRQWTVLSHLLVCPHTGILLAGDELFLYIIYSKQKWKRTNEKLQSLPLLTFDKAQHLSTINRRKWQPWTTSSVPELICAIGLGVAALLSAQPEHHSSWAFKTYSLTGVSHIYSLYDSDLYNFSIGMWTPRYGMLVLQKFLQSFLERNTVNTEFVVPRELVGLNKIRNVVHVCKHLSNHEDFYVVWCDGDDGV